MELFQTSAVDGNARVLNDDGVGEVIDLSIRNFGKWLMGQNISIQHRFR